MKKIKIMMMALIMCFTSLSFGQTSDTLLKISHESLDKSYLRINEICQGCILRSEESFTSDSLMTLKTNDYVEFIEIAKYPYIKVRILSYVGFLSVAYLDNPNIHPQFSQELEKCHDEYRKYRKNREPDNYHKYISSTGNVYEIKTWYNTNGYITKTFINGKLDSVSTGY